MEFTAKPEVLPPRTKRGGKLNGKLFDDENLDLLSHVLDDFLKIPGTSIRFGLDGIVGVIPGIGDVIGGIASCIIIIAAWMRGVSYVTLVRRMSVSRWSLDRCRLLEICSTLPGGRTGATMLCWRAAWHSRERIRFRVGYF
jgi:hypothetical protein